MCSCIFSMLLCLSSTLLRTCSGRSFSSIFLASEVFKPEESQRQSPERKSLTAFTLEISACFMDWRPLTTSFSRASSLLRKSVTPGFSLIILSCYYLCWALSLLILPCSLSDSASWFFKIKLKSLREARRARTFFSTWLLFLCISATKELRW